MPNPVRPSDFPKLLRDLIGRRVRLTEAVGNGFMIIPADTHGVIRHVTAWDRLSFEGDPCTCCGVKPLITRVSSSKVALLPID